MKIFLALLLACLTPFAALAESLPPCLQITQTTERTPLPGDCLLYCTMPTTANDAVNDALRARINALKEQAMPALPARAASPEEGAYLEVGASVFRTGDSWASFLLVASVLNGRAQTHVDFDACAFDMRTGALLTLRDVLSDDAALALIAQETRAQLTAYFPAETPDGAALDALTEETALLQAPFTLDTAFLKLHYRADALYPGHNTLMHVQIPYAALRPYFTPEADAQTDNSGRSLVALTYDDGPTRSITQKLVRALRQGCASATFFLVGDRIRFAPDLVAFAHDLGFAQGSHNYEHIYGSKMRGKVHDYLDRLNAALTGVTGRPVSLMRAPGGDEQVYIDEDVGLPIFHWSLVADDAHGGPIANPASEARRLAAKAEDGDIILCHDLFSGEPDVARDLTVLLNERGFLCVTLEELFAVKGIPLAPNQVYHSAK